MLSRTNSLTWIGDNIEEENPTISWSKTPCDDNYNSNNNNNDVVDNNNVIAGPFNSMLPVENGWVNFSTSTNNPPRESMNFMASFIDASSCTPSPSVALNPTLLDPAQISGFFASKGNNFASNLSQGFNFGCGENDGFFTEGEMGVIKGDYGLLGGFSDFQNNNNNIINNNNNNNINNNIGNINEIISQNLRSTSQFSDAHLVQMGGNDVIGFGSGCVSDPGFRGFEGGLMNSSVFINRTSKMLKPLDNSAPIGAQPTLFQKRAALRKNSTAGENENENENQGRYERKRKFDNVSYDGPSSNYDSDDVTPSGGTNSNANSSGSAGGGGGGKGKKKGPPAKNLMAERRRRKKLNDRLYMLRSIVPKISKMDRASILGDAIEYLKELLQKISNLHNELESSPCASTLTQTPNSYPLTPTLPNLPARIKEELYASPVPSPHAHAHAQPARIEVRSREGNVLNIHMFCGRKPGLLLSIVRALDGIGLDVQQGVISCFNGFALDIYRAEPCRDGEEVHPEQIRALLMNIAEYHGSKLAGN